MKKTYILILISTILVILCISVVKINSQENQTFENKIGFINQVSLKGFIFKSWECNLNVSQSPISSGESFNFSFDNDDIKHSDSELDLLDSAMRLGWKVQITYHTVFLQNWFYDRGETDYFIDNITILEKNKKE